VQQGIEGSGVQALGLALLARECVAVTEQTVVATCRRGHPVLVVGVGRARGLPAVTGALVQVIKVRAQQDTVRLRVTLLATVEEEVRIQTTGLGDDALEIEGLLFVGGKCAFSERETFVPSVTARMIRVKHGGVTKRCQRVTYMNERVGATSSISSTMPP
jgi:hypothetical protein